LPRNKFYIFKITTSVIEDAGPNGNFELYFSKGGERILLNPRDGELLHEMMPSDPM
jgi:hypothetical protein